jgi:hypothetical protein
MDGCDASIGREKTKGRPQLVSNEEVQAENKLHLHYFCCATGDGEESDDGCQIHRGPRSERAANLALLIAAARAS